MDFVHLAEAIIFGAISLTHVVLADCLGSRGLLQRASQGFCYDNNSPEFCKIIRQSCALNLKSLYGLHFLDGRQLLSYHHHNGSERCLYSLDVEGIMIYVSYLK